MSTRARGLRALCPQCCGTTLTIAMPTPAEVKRTTGRNHPANLDTLVGRNVVDAVLVHCYACTAISRGPSPDARSRGTRFPNHVSSADPLNCGDASCLRRCRRAFVSNSCP